MYKLFITDFIKSKLVQLSLLIALFIELLVSKTINYSLLLFFLPYCTSVILNYLMHQRSSKKTFTRVSAQFKPSTLNKIKIIPK